MSTPTQRYKLVISYRGSHYHGWQCQPAQANYGGKMPKRGQGIPTIQETLQRTMGEIVGHPVIVVGSSRTDTGVHAKAQLAHFDTPNVGIPPDGIRRAVNHRLPTDIVIRSIEPVADSFCSMRCTASKRYQYFIWNQENRSAFAGDLAWYRWQPLDVARMAEAAKYFVGTHDFASFCRPGHKRDTTVRTVLACEVNFRTPRLVIGVEGTGFLWNMVRIMVGTLVEIGMGRYEPDVIKEMIAAKDRRAAGPTAPPHGLYLQWIRMRASESTAEIPLTT